VGPTSDDQHALRYATTEDTSWTEPRTAARGADWFVNWADVPSLRPLPGGRLAAHFLKSNGPSALAYAVRITQTNAAGTWQPAVTPAKTATPVVSRSANAATVRAARTRRPSSLGWEEGEEESGKNRSGK
jgi:hypothetical protein